MKRADDRDFDQMRDFRITRNYLHFSEGSVLVEMGHTRVICAATMEEKIPPFLKNSGKGWLTAEYSMLPASTQKRSTRESAAGKIGGRTHEIQRLVGRSLRGIVDLADLGLTQLLEAQARAIAARRRGAVGVAQAAQRRGRRAKQRKLTRTSRRRERDRAA